ncbi:MAG: NADH-quinone oxidoreductase subunit I [Opitutaceae bacterium]|nr:NADH-quinone oxidoreductase subunit I [Opitutaceae bacterium]|tara:strand:- start:2123 stop:2500 length:378 start_codon:yes stop_codon:yes gene_type:complete
MSLEAFFPVLVQIVLALVITVGVIGASHLLGQRIRENSPFKGTPYECGMPAEGTTHTRFSVKFYVAAMLFILFDIEIMFLIPWAVVYRDFISKNIPILLPILFFLFVLIVGLFYEMKKGALEWER